MPISRVTSRIRNLSNRCHPERGGDAVEYVIVLLAVVVIGAGLLAFGTKVAGQVGGVGNTIGGWFGSGEDVFGGGSAGQAETAFAVYSEDDHSLDFYKRAEVPEVGDKFEFKTVTALYTGFESEKYVNFSNDDWGNWYGHEPNTPWWSVRNAVRTVKVVDSGIAPASIDYWFYQMENLSSIDVQKLDTSRCSDFFLTFGCCNSLTSIDLSSWSTQSLTKLNGTFLSCKRMKSLNLGGWETSNVVSFHCLFQNCPAMSDSAMQAAIDQLEITEKATDFGLMFECCDKLTLDCSNWNVRADANHDRFNNEAPGIILPKAWQ